ncbi:TPA: hypothetical protein F3L08_11695 [Aeromonas hydrophila]|nr:hypothetical protein [Aeromonas hydrophila]HAU4974878.1 hypothetical protein [Aeromonas hydrophila]HAU4984337.1 hypothetical protein [Aeromonas hydrophila]
MTSRTLSGRLARLEQRVDPDKQLKIETQVHFVELVDSDDPRCGSWAITMQEKTGNTTFMATEFFGLDLAHIKALQDEHRQQQLTESLHVDHQGA